MSRDSGLPPLSRREREVAALVAEGLTDRAIARRLFISERTVEGHVLRIREKLVLDNRTQIASWMTRASLTQADRPQARSSSPPNNLPVLLTRFVGRERDLAQTRQLLQRVRLLTVTGPGGCGKTRLAIHIAREVAHRYPAGLWFVDLSLASDPDMVPRKVASALGIRDPQGSDPLATLAAELALNRRRRPALVILDNCEHLVGGCARTIDVLLRGCPDLTFLCTSREPLHVAGEAIWRLGPLSLPRPAGVVSAEQVRQSEATQLFLDRVGLSDPTFELDDANATEVAQLCRELDGLPLAMELAAARVGLMSLGQILDHLGGRLRSLSMHGAPGRQQTLSTTIGWSYDLLSEAERQLLRRLSVFRDGFTRESAEAICGDPPRPDEAATFELLIHLVDKSLVLQVPPRQRYRCLDLIRGYAWTRLLETDEVDTIRRRHFEYFFDLAERAAGELTGPRQSLWLERLAEDHDNLRATLEFSRGERIERRLQLVLHLNRFWHVCGHIGEGLDWTQEALDAAENAAVPSLRAYVLNAASGLAIKQGDLVRARAQLEESLRTVRAMADRSGMQICLCHLGVVATARGEWRMARSLYQESLGLARELDDVRACGVVLCNLGPVMTCLGEHATAQTYAEEALRIMRRLGDTAREAIVLTNLGTASVYRGRDAEAADRYSEALRIMASLGTRQGLPECLEGLASISARSGHHERALGLASAASHLREATGVHREPWASRLLDDWIEEARTALGRASGRAWEEGGELSEQDAIALALHEG